jgi:hypothetical protein
VLTMAQLGSHFLGGSSWLFWSLWSISVWGAKMHLSHHTYPNRHQKYQGNDHSWCTFGDGPLFIIFCVLLQF